MLKLSILSFIVVMAASGCESLGVKTQDRNTGNENQKVTSQDISQGSGAVDNSEAANEQVTQPITRVENKVGSGGVLIAYEFKGNRNMVPNNGCRLKLENVTNSKATFANLKVDQTSVYKELPPGRYFATRLSCQTTKIWNLDSLFNNGFE